MPHDHQELIHQIDQLRTHFFEDLKHVTTDEALEHFRLHYLSRHGKLATLVGILKDLSQEQKRIIGPLLNSLKVDTNAAYMQKKDALLAQKIELERQRLATFDVTATIPMAHGSLHPYTKLIEKIENIFISMGYEIADGPEVETERFNFEALNIPADHPARDMWDTFWLEQANLLLRTHTSSVQVHLMMRSKPPIAAISTGRTYRHEATDASHDFMFLQCEGLYIDKNISIGNLLATIKIFLQTLFEKKDLQIRTRPSYFPFVEPGIEIDMSCPFCQEGCSVCKRSCFIEICGAGLLHPNVLSYCGIDPEKYSGFAFGFGLSRLVMLRYGITDIRLLHTPKIDFLKAF